MSVTPDNVLFGLNSNEITATGIWVSGTTWYGQSISEFNILENDFLNNSGKNCYSFENYEIDWNKGATHNDEISYGVSE